MSKLLAAVFTVAIVVGYNSPSRAGDIVVVGSDLQTAPVNFQLSIYRVNAADLEVPRTPAELAEALIAQGATNRVFGPNNPPTQRVTARIPDAGLFVLVMTQAGNDLPTAAVPVVGTRESQLIHTVIPKDGAKPCYVYGPQATRACGIACGNRSLRRSCR